MPDSRHHTDSEPRLRPLRALREMILGALGVIALVALTAVALNTLTTTDDARAASAGMVLTQKAHLAVGLDPDQAPEIVLRRTNAFQTTWSTLLHELGARVSHPGLQSVLSDHAPDASESVVMPRWCWVNLSAAALESGDTPLGHLRRHAGAGPMVWAYLALHEQAHCGHAAALREVAAAPHQRLQRLQQRAAAIPVSPPVLRQLPTLYFESHADALAVLMLAASEDGAEVVGLVQQLVRWRNDPASRSLYSTHYTTGALMAAGRRIPLLRETLRNTPLQERNALVHRWAAEAVEEGLMRYLDDLGGSRPGTGA